MLTPNAQGAQDLTQEEQILHHHAAVVEKDLEAYRAYSQSQGDWKKLFNEHLVHFILVTQFYRPFSDSYR